MTNIENLLTILKGKLAFDGAGNYGIGSNVIDISNNTGIDLLDTRRALDELCEMGLLGRCKSEQNNMLYYHITPELRQYEFAFKLKGRLPPSDD